MRTKSSSGRVERFGFSHKRGSAHMARTMMLSELRQLLDSVPASSPLSEVYIRAIEEHNALGKRSSRTRTLTRRHLADLYALRPDTTLFRILRYFWQRDPEGHPLIACLCAYARDPLLRGSQYEKGIHHILETYIKNIGQSQPPAVWVSGFYGSGMGQEARKPIFHLTPADGAIGSHAQAVQEAYKDFKSLAKKLLEAMGTTTNSSRNP